MKSASRYYFSFLLLLLSSAWVVHFIYPILYSVNIHMVRSEQKEKVNTREANFIRIQLDVSQFEHDFIPGDNELAIDGEMYDVVSYERKGNTVYCVALPDKEETSLHLSLAEQTGNAREGKICKQAVYWWPLIYKTSILSLATTPVLPILKSHKTQNSFFRMNDFKNDIMQPPELA